MICFKKIIGDYIVSYGQCTDSINTEISKDEYMLIDNLILNKPIAPEGYDYRLKDTLEWELVELPEPEPIDEEATIEDYENALAEVGI